MSRLKSPNLISRIFEPTRVFIALLIAVIIWLYPAIIGGSERQQEPALGSLIAYPPPLQAFFQTDSASAGNDCPDECNEQWMCTLYHQGICSEADFVCVCPPVEPPPPQPPQITGTLNCSHWGNNGWCIGSLKLDLSASDPQGQTISVSGILNGLEVTCNVPKGTACPELTIPIDTEGTGTIPYRVDSATGLNVSKSIDYKLDTSTPALNRTLSGVTGTNNWYRSDVTLNVTASDAISGMASITTTIDEGPQTEYAGPITISDGIHTVKLTAADNAGNVTQTTQTIQVDTITPTLSTSLSGTSGLNGWYVSIVSITPTASDSGSGLAALEASLDGGAWFPVSGPPSFSDGPHSYQFRTTDNAGNSTTLPVQNLKVDTIFPDIDMTESLTLGESVFYILEDHGSGLSKFQAVIEDDRERYKKIVWVDDISGENKMESEIVWDGKFADGAQAGVGEYFITLKIGDAAGNESMKTAVVSVEPFSFLRNIPVFSPPQSDSLLPMGAPFGDDKGQGEGTDSLPSTFSEGGTSNISTEDAITESGFSIESVSTNTNPFAPSNILWGAAATALLGATLADWQRKREEEARVKAMTRRKRLAAEAGPLDVDDGNTYGRIAKAYQASLNTFKATLVANGVTVDAANKLKSNATSGGKIPTIGIIPAPITLNSISEGAAPNPTVLLNNVPISSITGEPITLVTGNTTLNDIAPVAGAAQGAVDNANANQRMENKMAKIDAIDEAKWTASQAVIAQREQEKVKAEEQTGLQAYYEGRKTGEVATNVPKKDEIWLENVWNKAFNNQVELSLGTGIVVGVAAVVAVVAGVITAPAWLVVGGAVLVTAAIVTAGTVALNAHFGLGLGNNLATNLVIGTAATLIITGVGLLLTTVAPLIGTTIVNTCAQYTTVCTQIGTIVDKGEEALLAGQLAYYTWTGNQDNAAQTAIELQLEQMDGNVPGNSVANELSEQIAKLGPDAAELIAKQGNDVIPLLLKYGDDAVDIIGAYGDEGTALLTMYGDDAAKLIKEYGTPAVDLVISHGDDAIRVYQSGSPTAGPLSDFIPDDYYDDVLNAFKNNPNAITLNDDLTVYRYWSGDDRREIGSWVTLNSNLTPDEARKLLALPDSNLAVNVTQFTIPAQTTILLGEAAEQTSSSWAGAYAAGGGLQIYLSNPSVLVKNQ